MKKTIKIWSTEHLPQFLSQISVAGNLLEHQQEMNTELRSRLLFSFEVEIACVIS